MRTVPTPDNPSGTNPPHHVPASQGGDTLSGFCFAFAAYFLWGFLALYLKLLEDVPSLEVVASRIFWSVPVAAIILVALSRTSDILPTLRDRRKLAILFACAALISSNWGIYVWAISVNRAVDCALGYYINPLISVAFGAIFLGERLSRLQAIAVLIAVLAVVYLTVINGSLPWISISLPVTFALYGLLRKTVDVGPVQGFFVEVMLISILAVPYLIWLSATGESHFGANWYDTLLLMGCGPVTAVPLILFAAGAKRLRLATIGMMQYIAPTMIMLTGVFAFGEPFGTDRVIAFSLIWLSLAIFSYSMLRREKPKAA